MSRFSSITHVHLYAIINTIVKYKFTPAGITLIRILDVGCGNGILLSTLVRELPLKNSGLTFEFYGLEVYDSHIQEQGFFRKTVSFLESVCPSINWGSNIRLIASKDQWPFEDNFFDIILSNQVMEHVFDQNFFLSEIRRTMKYDGFSFHLYPLRHYIYEGHLLIPFAHKFRGWTTTYFWIKWASYFGMGTYAVHKKNKLVASRQEYAEKHADYLTYEVNYQTIRQISETSKKAGLKCSFDFTYTYYKQKLRSLLLLRPLEIYSKSDLRSSKNSFYFIFLKYVSGITLMLTKNRVL